VFFTTALQTDSNPTNLALTAVDATALNQPVKLTLSDVVNNPKSVASTYHPPEPRHEKHGNHHTKNPVQHIQQPDRSKN